MLRTAMREKIFEYIGRKQSSAEWQKRKRLPELAKQLEDILYTKFPNRNDYYNMMKGPVEPQLQYAIRTLSTQNQQNQQNPQMARDTASSFATMTPVGNHDALCGQSAPLLADTQNNNADECARTGNKRRRVVHGLSPDKGEGSSFQADKEVPKEPFFTCPICWNKMEEPSTTSCGHVFCNTCIKQAIQVRKKCPTCRKVLRATSVRRIYLPSTGS